MQNMNQAKIPEPTINTPISARYPLDTHHPSLFLSYSEKISLTKNQCHTSTPQNKDRNITSTSNGKTKKGESEKPDYILLERNGYNISLVNSLKQRIKVSTLIKHKYAMRGYHTKDSSIFSSNPNQITFAAYSEELLLGTVTLIIDSNKGLLADQLYKQEIDFFRKKNKNRKICELSKFAFNSGSKEVFASLFHVAYAYAYSIYRVEDAFIEINPRHILFYKRMMGFKQIGRERICQRVNAPAVLLHLNRDYMRNQILIQAGSTQCSKKSIYPYFLTQQEERSIINRILRESIRQHPIRHSTLYSHPICDEPL